MLMLDESHALGVLGDGGGGLASAQHLSSRVDVIMEDDIKIGQFMKNHPTAAMEFATGYKVAPEEYGARMMNPLGQRIGLF